MEYESREHYEAEMGYAGQAEAEALAQEAEAEISTQAEPFKYVCMECKHGFEGNCNGCYLLNQQVKESV